MHKIEISTKDKENTKRQETQGNILHKEHTEHRESIHTADGRGRPTW